MLKLFSVIIASFMVQLSFSQSFEGNWVGNVSNTNGSIQGEMTLKNQPNNQLSGELVVFGGNERDSYIIKGTYTANSASGKLTYKDGTIFDFVMNQNNGQLQQKISFHGQVILEGKFSRKSPNATTTTPNTVKTDNLYRDPKLVGKWVYSENYNSSGGFYGGTQSTIILNADGTVDDGGSASYASGGGNSVMNNGGGNQTIAQLKALGARWYTKGNIF